MGGNAKKMYFPESIEELESLVKNDPDILKYVIGGGSNLIINDEREFDEVLCLREFNKDFSDKGNGRFYIGASVRLQKAIKSVNAAGYGGMEFLFSVPGLIGGALYMNAGTGRKTGKYISDFVSEPEFEAISGQIALSHDTLHNGTGLGNDKLGWLTLPTDYDKEEFARIKAAAERIKKNSDVFIVIGILFSMPVIRYLQML